MNNNANQLSPRQVHLDFHTSENIPAIAADFNAKEFAKTVKEAYVSSMTVFARCHHGWLYYPSEEFPELVHPNLVNKNLLLEQVRELHNEGINAPVYITVQWDYHHATTRPEWLIRNLDGSHMGGAFTVPGFYQSLCVNTGYYDLLAAQTAEVCRLLGPELDGLFFDIVCTNSCYCASCRAEMKKLGIDASNEEEAHKFGKMVMDRFKANMSALVRSYNKDCTIFYNAGHVGPCTKNSADSYSHFELESLPSGGWGYLHFPVTARYARKLDKDCIGMTGKFHTAWGDFHSLKNIAALEFECFRMLSYGFASSIGDQLEPSGTLGKATYNLIGKIYKQFAEREEWARPSNPVVEAAVLTAENPMVENALPESLMGACQLLEELAIQFDIVDHDMELSSYKLLIIPDGCTVSRDFQGKLDRYVAGGGKIISCADGGLYNESYPTCYDAEYNGMSEKSPDFLVARGKLANGLEQDNEYVIYKHGVSVKPNGAEVLMTARAPYFNREGDKFCSHKYTPSAKGAEYPSVLISQNKDVILFSHPVFAQYRANAPMWCKTLISNAIDLLLEARLVRHDGPSTMTVSLLEQPEKHRYTAHLLSYIPVRKSASIDIIEERTVLYNVTLELKLPKAVSSARLVPENVPLEIFDGKITIPKLDGYSIIELT